MRKMFFIAAVCALAAAPAGAELYNFRCVNMVPHLDGQIGEQQLTVDVTDPGLASDGTARALFTFVNAGPYASSITDIYFDDGTLLGVSAITSSAGVSFTSYAVLPPAPPDLPNWQNLEPPFHVTQGFGAGSIAPVQPNGVNPYEWVAITFNLINDRDFASVIDSLQDKTLRIGIHVQGFADGGSKSFVNKVVPVPGAILLGLLGLGAAGLKLRRSA